MRKALLAVGIAVAIVALAILTAPKPASAQFAPPAVESSQIVPIIVDAGFELPPPVSNDVYGNSFVALNQSPDGGAGKYSFISNTDSCIKLGSGTQAEICAAGNTTTVNVSSLNLPTTFIAQPACPPSTSCRWFADVGTWFGIFPSSSVTGCGASTEGGLKANSTDHHPYYCDGTTAQKIPFVTSIIASLDFPNTPAMTTNELTQSFPGVEVGDVVTCRAIADTPEGWIIRQTYVSSVDEVTIDGFYMALAGSLDPPAQNYECAATRP